MEKLNAEILLELKKTQDALQESQRSAAIEREMGKYRQKGAKRNIGFCMKLQHKFEDIDFVLKVKDGEEFVTDDNIEDANAAIKELRSIVSNLKDLVQKELNAQIVGATSPHGWKTVDMMEGSSKLSEFATVDHSELRKAEKELMSYERDLRNSRSYVSKRDGESEGYNGSYKRGKYGKGRGGATSSGSGSGRGCYKCGSLKHLIDDCPDQNPNKNKEED